MAASFNSLPPEIVEEVLSYLELKTLLAFSSSNRTYYSIAKQSLQQLDLTVLPNKSFCDVAKALDSCDDGWHITRTTEKLIDRLMDNRNLYRTIVQRAHPDALLHEQITLQNRLAADVLNQDDVRSLRSLTLRMFDLQSEKVTSSIAQMPRLEQLELKFHHPYVQSHLNSKLPYNYWSQAPEGHACWNALVGLGAEHQQQLRMRGLRRLHIERAGLTSAQLRCLIESNPRLEELYLDNITGVDNEFTSWLGHYSNTEHCNLRIIDLLNCSKLRFGDSQDGEWLVSIARSDMKRLTITRCQHLDFQILAAAVELIRGNDFKHLNVNLLPREEGFLTINRLRTCPPAPVNLHDYQTMLKREEVIEVDPWYA